MEDFRAHSSKPTECASLGVNLTEGLSSVVMMCSWRFVRCHERMALVGDVCNRGGCAHVGAGDLSVPSIQFAVKLKLL